MKRFLMPDFQIRKISFLKSKMISSLIIGFILWWVFLPDQMVYLPTLDSLNHDWVQNVKDIVIRNLYREEINDVLNNANLIQHQQLQDELKEKLREGAHGSAFALLILKRGICCTYRSLLLSSVSNKTPFRIAFEKHFL